MFNANYSGRRYSQESPSSSSHFINHENRLKESRYWQDGYGVITLRDAEIAQVARYIEGQIEQHRTGKLSELLERITPPNT